MSAAAQTAGVTVAQKWRFPLQDVFGDLRVRYGIKVGLAALLALYFTQVLRLPHDSWAILSVLVMMSAQYVGSIAVKAVMRVVGTIVGAILGIWLVGDYSSTPAIFCLVLFLVIAITSYKFGQVGVRQLPYAYFLVGLTTLTVVTNGVAAPDQAWEIGLTRTEEILVGVLSSLLVSTILWPRYAREDFVAAGRYSLRIVGELVSIQAKAYSEGTGDPIRVEQIRQDFMGRLVVLRNQLQAGSRESSIFYARISNYNAFLVSLLSLYQGAFYLTRGRQLDAPVVARLRSELELLTAAISEEVEILAAPNRPGQTLPSSRLHEAFQALEAKVIALREGGFFATQSLEVAMTFAGHFGALRSLCDELTNVRGNIEGLPRFGQPPPRPKPHWGLLPTIDWFWLKAGVKSGVVAVLSIVLLKWIHPPGPAAFPLMAWLTVLLSRPYIRVGGTGDMRSFQNAFLASLVLLGCVAILLVITPFLENYLLMNLVLFFILFWLGFFTARVAGVSFWMQIAYLSISSFVGLNPQQPVLSQTIIDTFLGMIGGLVLATVIGRLLWPVLPQKLLRDDLLTTFADIKSLLKKDPNQERTLARLAIVSVEAVQAIRQIKMARCASTERSRLTELIRELQAVVSRIKHLVSHRDDLPEGTEPILRPRFELLEYEFGQLLDAFAECFRQCDCRRELPTLEGALAGMDGVVQQIRESQILARQPAEAGLRMLDLVGRYHTIASALGECARLIRGLEIQRYWGDYAL